MSREGAHFDAEPGATGRALTAASAPDPLWQAPGGSVPLWAIIFKPWADEPVYHRATPGKLNPGRTVCGRPVDARTPWLPFKHVVKFGRPCRGCFPS